MSSEWHRIVVILTAITRNWETWQQMQTRVEAAWTGKGKEEDDDGVGIQVL